MAVRDEERVVAESAFAGGCFGDVAVTASLEVAHGPVGRDERDGAGEMRAAVGDAGEVLQQQGVVGRGVAVTAGTVTYKLKDIYPKPNDADALQLIFDFGRMPAGTKISVTDIVFQEYIQ